MSIRLVLTIALLTAYTNSQVKEINPSTFQSIFQQSFQQFEAGSKQLTQDCLILFYSPEIDESLDAREIMHRVSETYEDQLIANFKKKGLVQFEEFERQMMKYPQIAEIDCGQNTQMCQTFQITAFPNLVYLKKSRKAYLYSGWIKAQEMVSFLGQAIKGTINPRFAKPHELGSSQLKFMDFVNSETVLYFVVFLIAPFAYGYFFMNKAQPVAGKNVIGKTNKQK